jgi:hypothetical protein
VISLITGQFFAALGLLVSVSALLAPWFYGAPLWRPAAGVLLISGVFFVIGIRSLIAGIGLLRHSSWARILAIILAVLAVVRVPIGTAVGLCTLWVLTQNGTEQLLGTQS